MASAYPHMIFATEAAGLDKDRLVALLNDAVPGGTSEQTALKLTWTREGYTYTYWFEDADRVGEMYADYLPEGARRRPVINATTVIDMSGDADPDGTHADEARGIVEHLAAQDGVHVFAEGAKRFVGMAYGDEPAPEPTPTPAAAPEPEPVVSAEVVEAEVAEAEVVAVGEPQVGDVGEPGVRVDEPSGDEVAYPAAPEPEVAPEPAAPEPEVAPEPAAPEPEVAPEPPAQPERLPGQLPTTPEPAPTPAPEPTSAPAPSPAPAPEPQPLPRAEPIAEPAPIAEPEPIPAPEPVSEKGFLKKLFGRR